MDGRPGIGNKTTAGEEEKQTQLEKKKRRGTRAESIIAQSHSGYILGICVALCCAVDGRAANWCGSVGTGDMD